MTVTVDTTVGGASANSYVSAAEADTYVGNYVLDDDRRGEWLNYPADTKARLLLLACRNIDGYMAWSGEKASKEQALEWPRESASDSHGYSIDSDIIPQCLKDAQVEAALWLKDNSGKVPQSNYSKFDSIKVGSISINYNQTSGGPAQQYLPDNVLALLSTIGEFETPTGVGGGVGVATLVRT